MKFTIAIPAYKNSYLKGCIDSILTQTYTDFELIIVNDASPHDIDAVIYSYPSSLIKYYKNEINFGAANVVDNWNKCLSYANGDFFILMGDDDKIQQNYLEEFSKLIEKFPCCGVYHCRSIIVNENSVPIQLTEPLPEFETVYDLILSRIKGNRHFFISDYVFRTELLKSNGGFYKMPLAWASDDISAYIAAEKYGIAHTNKPVFIYRQNSKTISSTGSVFLKMNSILKEEGWLLNFLKKPPQNDIDKILWKNLQTEVEKYIQKNKMVTIYSLDGSSRFFVFFKWLFRRKKYRLSIEELLYALLMNIKNTRKKKYGGKI